MEDIQDPNYSRTHLRIKFTLPFQSRWQYSIYTLNLLMDINQVIWAPNPSQHRVTAMQILMHSVRQLTQGQAKRVQPDVHSGKGIDISTKIQIQALMLTSCVTLDDW